MNLPFSTEINGMPTFFVIKIWSGLLMNNLVEFQTLNEYKRLHIEKFGKSWATDPTPGKPKIHTIRKHQIHVREGRILRFTIEDNRNGLEYFQFAPNIKTKAVQYIRIEYYRACAPYPVIKIYDSAKDCYCGDIKKELNPVNHFEYITDLQELAENDGFERWQDFLDYFNEDGIYKIIHWTDKMY